MQVEIKKQQSGLQSNSDGELEVSFKIKIPSHILNTSSNIVVSGAMQEQRDQQDHQFINYQASYDKKALAQRLLAKKGQQHPTHHPHDGLVTNQQALIHSSKREPRDQQSVNYREQRQRTREKQVRENKTQKSPQPTQTKQYPTSKKISFLPKFNDLDGIFTLGKQLYALRSLSCAGFMIINNFPCSIRQPNYIRFKVILPKLEEDDCGVGITYDPLDLVQKKMKKNPIKRCMGYYFASQKLLIAGSQYAKNIRYSPERSYKLIVNAINKTFILADDNGTLLIRKSIPQAFIEKEMYIFLELKNGGKIQILQ